MCLAQPYMDLCAVPKSFRLLSCVIFRQSNPDISHYMNQTNITGNYAKLEQVYIQKVLNISKDIGFSYVVWQEVFDNGVVVSSKLC